VGFELGRVLAYAKKPDADASARFATKLLTGGVSGFGIARTTVAAKRPKGEVAIRGSLP
jgi:HAMP domain-containing protein